MYNEMIKYIQKLLKGKLGAKSKNKISINYDRFDHTRRVFKWVRYLCDELNTDFDREDLYIAAIFHDAGYSKQEDFENHAKYSSQICRYYLNNHTDFSDQRINHIVNLVSNHSDKTLLYKDGTSLDMIILLEADLLDDTGAMGLVIDSWIRGKIENTTFEDILEKMKKHTYITMMECPLVTEAGKKIWNEKMKLTKEFMRQYEFDIKI